MGKFDNNMTVYVNCTWCKAEKCTIIDCIPDEENTNESIYMLKTDFGTFGASEKDIFATKKEAIDAAGNKSRELTEKYKSEIKDINDLLRFPIKHCFCGEEYTDYEAMAAYKARAKELCSIDI